MGGTRRLVGGVTAAALAVAGMVLASGTPGSPAGPRQAAAAPACTLANGVQHVIHPPVHLAEWPDDDRASRLVFVVQGIAPDNLGRSLATFLRASRGRERARIGEMADRHV